MRTLSWKFQKARTKIEIFLALPFSQLNSDTLSCSSKVTLLCLLVLHTLLYEMPSNSKGKNFVWKIYCFFPLNLRVLPANSDGIICKKWMQNALRFVMKNRSFSSLINNFKIRIKSYLSKRKNFYFSSEIWGRFAFTFCRYLHQNLQALPSESVAGNTLGKNSICFRRSFFH